MDEKNFAILVNGKVETHPPKDYGDDQAEGEAPVRVGDFIAAQLRLPESERRTGLDDLRKLRPGESDTRNGVTITRVGGDVCRVVDVTFDTVSEESAAKGDTDRRGWKDTIVITIEDLDEDDPSWVDATIRAIRDENPSALEADCSSGVPRWFVECDAQIDEERRDFHVEGGGFTDEEILAIAKGLGVYGYR